MGPKGHRRGAERSIEAAIKIALVGEPSLRGDIRDAAIGLLHQLCGSNLSPAQAAKRSFHPASNFVGMQNGLRASSKMVIRELTQGVTCMAGDPGMAKAGGATTLLHPQVAWHRYCIAHDHPLSLAHSPKCFGEKHAYLWAIGFQLARLPSIAIWYRKDSITCAPCPSGRITHTGRLSAGFVA